MAKSFESLANYGSATFYVLMEVVRSLGTTLRAMIATTIFVDQRLRLWGRKIAFTIWLLDQRSGHIEQGSVSAIRRTSIFSRHAHQTSTQH